MSNNHGISLWTEEKNFTPGRDQFKSFLKISKYEILEEEEETLHKKFKENKIENTKIYPVSSKNRGNKLQILGINEVKNQNNFVEIIDNKIHIITNEKNKA